MACEWGTNIDRYELEETILSQHGYDDFEASFRVGVEQRQAPCVSLDQELGSDIERARRMFPQQGWLGYAQVVLDILNV